MVNVQTEINIRVPRTDVAGYAANPENAPQWYQNIDSARWLTEPPLRVGSKTAFSARFLGDDMVHAPRAWRTSPEFAGLSSELPAGAAMEHALFPVVFPRITN